ncbi:chloride channel protein [Acidimangrovimonas sediminis]|uniref:chloride channel protein n=1 Tax=Acidimangrovimonas sediminis TaxID=2056283 RepID=UPI001E321419|nr:chloride channel protein [Acidimangrovimonas sediminis]
MVTSKRQWKSRLVFWIGALAIGAVSAAFARLADEAQILFHAVIGGGGRGWLPLIITPLGFVLCAWLADRFFPGSQGSGIPQAIAIRHMRDDTDRARYLTMRIVFGKIALTLAGLASGASIGREGPTVQVGAALMLLAGRIGGMAQARGLILAGSAAGIAAAFNTPLAGIVFAIEEMSRSYQARTNGVVLSTVIIAGIASLAIVGNYTYFGFTNATAQFPGDWPLVIACGVVGGVLGGAFSKLVLSLTNRIRRWRSITPRRRVLVVAFLAGLVLALTGVAYHGDTFGTGYEQARFAIEGHVLDPTYFLAKFVATVASTVSGIPGGLFAPSLAVGAGMGSTLGYLLGGSASLAAVLGMAGYFAGVVQAPMTAFVIIVEMTGNHDNVVPVMASAMIGYGVSRMLSPQPLYHGLSRLWIADALRKRRAEEQGARAA